VLRRRWVGTLLPYLRPVVDAFPLQLELELSILATETFELVKNCVVVRTGVVRVLSKRRPLVIANALSKDERPLQRCGGVNCSRRWGISRRVFVPHVQLRPSRGSGASRDPALERFPGHDCVPPPAPRGAVDPRVLRVPKREAAPTLSAAARIVDRLVAHDGVLRRRWVGTLLPYLRPVVDAFPLQLELELSILATETFELVKNCVVVRTGVVRVLSKRRPLVIANALSKDERPLRLRRRRRGCSRCWRRRCWRRRKWRRRCWRRRC